jgi:glucose dehydrogenase
MKQSMSASCLALLFAGVTATTFAASTATDLPNAKTLLSASQDEANWSLPAKTYSGNRYTALTQIDKSNVDTLSVAWKTSIADDGQQYGLQALPTTDLPALQHVTLGATTCAPTQSTH